MSLEYCSAATPHQNAQPIWNRHDRGGKKAIALISLWQNPGFIEFAGVKSWRTCSLSPRRTEQESSDFAAWGVSPQHIFSPSHRIVAFAFVCSRQRLCAKNELCRLSVHRWDRWPRLRKCQGVIKVSGRRLQIPQNVEFQFFVKLFWQS